MLFSGVLCSLALGASGAWNTVVNPASGKCLEVTALRDEATVQLSRCTRYGANQRWALNNETLVNPASGMCLDIYNPDELSPGKWKDATKVQLRECTGKASQHWVYVTGYKGGSHMLLNPESNKCLDISCPQCGKDAVEFGDETPVQIHACEDLHQGLAKFSQDWRLTSYLSNTFSDDDFIAVGCGNAALGSGDHVDMGCPDGYEPILDKDDCMEAMNRFTRAESGVNWTRPVATDESSVMPLGCYQQLSTCGRQEFSELHLNRVSQGGATVDCSGCLQSTLFCKRVEHDDGRAIQV